MMNLIMIRRDPPSIKTPIARNADIGTVHLDDSDPAATRLRLRVAGGGPYDYEMDFAYDEWRRLVGRIEDIAGALDRHRPAPCPAPAKVVPIRPIHADAPSEC